jgi:hypothetical protein
MTTLDLSTIKPIPGFDCVEMKREIQAKIYEETKHMTPEEQRERLRKNSEEFWADIERRRAERQAALAESADK